MSSIRFAKDSKEWQMFVDFWNICQKYWIVDKGDDKYWESVISEIDEFTQKYKEITLSRQLALAFMTDLEKRSKNGE